MDKTDKGRRIDAHRAGGDLRDRDQIAEAFRRQQFTVPDKFSDEQRDQHVAAAETEQSEFGKLIKNPL